MDGLQKQNGKINHFSPLGLAEAANTCRTAESAVTCQQMWWLSPRRSFPLVSLPPFLKFDVGMYMWAAGWTRYDGIKRPEPKLIPTQN